MQVHCIALLALTHAVLGSIFPVPGHLNDAEVNVATTTGKKNNGGISGNSINAINAKPGNRTMAIARRRAYMKARRSTSSSSGERLLGKDKSSGDSMGMKSSGESSTGEEQQRKPLEGGGGWRKWHRQCTMCPEEMAKKWRDPTIKWICGGYQRARRSFKSECMMYYRNCQDGTMFVKIHDHRCDEKAVGYTGGKHFFYDYQVKLPDDTSGKSMQTDEASSDSDSDSNYKKSDSGDG